MSITLQYANSPKRRNSTKQATFTPGNEITCTLKDTTSLDHPTFLIEATWIGFNVVKWSDRYYLVDDVRSVRNGLWEVDCVLDVLATYKSDILASTQFVCYSSSLGDTWLPDTRVPIKKNAVKSYVGGSISQLDAATGAFVLSVNGESGCESYVVSRYQLGQLIANITTASDALMNDILSGVQAGMTFDWTTVEGCIQALSACSVNSGFLGNQYANIPQMIRSCNWVPFSAASISGGSKRIMLGNFDTGINANVCHTSPIIGSVTLSIPWTYNDWRRVTCENLMLHLPFAGNVNLSVDDLAQTSSITVRYSISALDGAIAYELEDGSKSFGMYAGNCSAPFPIGLNQSASAGEVFQTFANGLEKVVGCAINSSIAPQSIVGAVAGIAVTGVEAIYNVKDVSYSTHPSTIGAFGGAAAAGLNTQIMLINTTHQSLIAPSSMQATMGLPTMKPMSLSSLTGYCQCANAHLACDANATEMDAIDTYLNSGFFIE